MTSKIILYFFIIFGSLYLERKYGIYGNAVFSDLLFVLVILGTYLFLLFIELRKKVAENLNYKDLRKAGFVFSFWVGFGCGILISFYRGFPKFTTLHAIIFNLFGYGLTGLAIGFVGVGITSIFLRLILNLCKDNKNT